MALDGDSAEFGLLEAIGERVFARVDEGLGVLLGTLTEEERVFALAWIADAEVQNGGLFALWYNPAGDHLAEIPAALDAIGAGGQAELVRRMVAEFGPGGPSPDLETRNEALLALPEDAIERIGELDELYYGLSEDVDELLVRWIRSSEGLRAGS